MKVLIWIGCFFCFAIVQIIIKESGIILGGIPTALLFLLTWFVIQKLCKKWDNRIKPTATEAVNNATIVDNVREPNSDIETIEKKKNEGASFLAKISSFILSKKKIVWVLIIVGVVLNITSLIAYASLDVYMEKLYRHYDETEAFSVLHGAYEYGCGMTSCSYCKGNIIRSYNESFLGPYQIEKYSFVSDVQMFFELSCVITIALTLTCSTFLIFAIVYQRKKKYDKKL